MLNNIVAVLAKIAGALLVLKQFGVNTGTLGQEALDAIDATEATIADYQNGQAVVVASFTDGGVAGVLVAMNKTGPAYKSLFGG